MHVLPFTGCSSRLDAKEKPSLSTEEGGVRSVAGSLTCKAISSCLYTLFAPSNGSKVKRGRPQTIRVLRPLEAVHYSLLNSSSLCRPSAAISW